MKPSKPADSGTPSPEDLAAYVDGLLESVRQRDVETWLRNHPEAAVEIQEQRRLENLWQATTPAEPAEACWPRILTRIERAYVQFRLARARKRRLIPLGAAALAASLLLTLWLPRGQDGVGPTAGEPLAVVSPDDVEIVSLHAADRDTLPVGVPPVDGPLVLASAGDVELEGVQPAADGMVPSIHMDERSTTPMIVAPLEARPQEVP
jgi:anti-sigma factor RsiW